MRSYVCVFAKVSASASWCTGVHVNAQKVSFPWALQLDVEHITVKCPKRHTPKPWALSSAPLPALARRPNPPCQSTTSTISILYQLSRDFLLQDCIHGFPVSDLMGHHILSEHERSQKVTHRGSSHSTHLNSKDSGSARLHRSKGQPLPQLGHGTRGSTDPSADDMVMTYCH